MQDLLQRSSLDPTQLKEELEARVESVKAELLQYCTPVTSEFFLSTRLSTVTCGSTIKLVYGGSYWHPNTVGGIYVHSPGTLFFTTLSEKVEKYRLHRRRC
jgi:hypothetical protein